MKLKRDKLREISKSYSIPFTGRTLKEDLARNIAKHNIQQIHNPYEVKTNYKIYDDAIQKISLSVMYLKESFSITYKGVHLSLR